MSDLLKQALTFLKKLLRIGGELMSWKNHFTMNDNDTTPELTKILVVLRRQVLYQKIRVNALRSRTLIRHSAINDFFNELHLN